MKELLTLLPFLRKYAVLISAGLVLVVVANAFSLVPPYLIREAIDTLGTPDADRGVIGRYAVLILGAAILGGAARYGMRELLNGVSRRVEFDLRNQLFEHLLRLDARFYGSMQTGEIMSRATNDIAAVRMVAGPAYMYLVNTIVISIFVIVLMAWISPTLTLVAMAPLLLLPPVTIGFGNLIHQRFEKIQERFGAMSTMVQENLAGVRIVKAYGQEDRQIGRFSSLASDYLERNLALARVSGLFHPLLALFSGLAMAATLFLGGRAVAAGSITTGDFVAFLLYLAMLTWPMIALGWVVNLFQRGAASMRRINVILDQRSAIGDPPTPRPTRSLRGEIEFRNVSFRYPGTDRDVLRNVTFHLPAGSMLAIVGATGSGKSTLVNLLVRVHDPTQGEVLVDGIPTREMPLTTLRSAIGMVPQDPFLFSDTIRQNLVVGSHHGGNGASAEVDAEIQRAAQVAQLDATIREFPAGYDTILGERGVNLSGGQKQRATLARAIARRPAILVLDDALSAVDTHTEADILHGLRDVMRGRTGIVVSHRVSAVMDADLILVLEDGVIAESGTHSELLARGGTYGRLLRRQLLSEELGEDAVLAHPKTDV
jgi:ATP-binding cassette, subfamily B, multidrug efflux pump